MRRRILASLGHKLTARDYVQDGLVRNWDGIENVSLGLHDSLSEVWVDLITGLEARVQSESYWDVDGLRRDTRVSAPSMAQISVDTYSTDFAVFKTVEIVASLNSDTGFVVSQSSYRVPQYSSTIPHLYVWNGGSRLYLGNYSAKSATRQDGVAAYVFTQDLIDGEFQTLSAWVNGVREDGSAWNDYFSGIAVSIGGTQYNRAVTGKICAVRLYDRVLTPAEIAANYAIDKARFGIT